MNWEVSYSSSQHLISTDSQRPPVDTERVATAFVQYRREHFGRCDIHTTNHDADQYRIIRFSLHQSTLQITLKTQVGLHAILSLQEICNLRCWNGAATVDDVRRSHSASEMLLNQSISESFLSFLRPIFYQCIERMDGDAMQWWMDGWMDGQVPNTENKTQASRLRGKTKQKRNAFESDLLCISSLYAALK